ncbi:PREDICTED: serine/arginine repetitive matrix protein 1-like, partial [Chinchilla lanigera]|uniref:serine/arginine repetitive matrix protein 1-like n=1 Tax=Chinchilla lanigera TaxID=34839 RepID=UPI00069773A1
AAASRARRGRQGARQPGYVSAASSARRVRPPGGCSAPHPSRPREGLSGRPRRPPGSRSAAPSARRGSVPGALGRTTGAARPPVRPPRRTGRRRRLATSGCYLAARVRDRRRSGRSLPSPPSSAALDTPRGQRGKPPRQRLASPKPVRSPTRPRRLRLPAASASRNSLPTAAQHPGLSLAEPRAQQQPRSLAAAAFSPPLGARSNDSASNRENVSTRCFCSPQRRLSQSYFGCQYVGKIWTPSLPRVISTCARISEPEQERQNSPPLFYREKLEVTTSASGWLQLGV